MMWCVDNCTQTRSFQPTQPVCDVFIPKACEGQKIQRWWVQGMNPKVSTPLFYPWLFLVYQQVTQWTKEDCYATACKLDNWLTSSHHYWFCSSPIEVSQPLKVFLHICECHICIYMHTPATSCTYMQVYGILKCSHKWIFFHIVVVQGQQCIYKFDSEFLR